MKKLFSVILSLCMALTWLFNSVPTAARAEEEAPAAPMELLAAKEISKYIDYSSAVEHGHVARVYAEEDMNTLVYLNQDGTKTAYFFDHDVKYEDADGNIKEKDIGLKTVDGGFGLKQSDITLKLPTDVLDGVEFTHNGNYIKLVPLVDNMQTSIGQLVTQPMDAVVNAADNEVTYGRAFGVGVSLKYTPVINGVKEDIILNSYTGENTWSFLLTTNGMYPFTDEGGVYYFAKTANAANKYSLGRVYAYDSNGSEAYGTMDVTEVKPGAMYIVSLAVDDTFLQGAEYPVTVDPTISVPQGGISDAVLYSKYPTQNYGNDIAGYVGYSGVENGRNIGRALFRFDSLINSTAFGYISTVTSAQFILPMAVVIGTHTLSVHQCTLPNWSESTVTWNSASTYFNASAYSTVTAQANTNAVFNVTSAVNAWRNNANYRTGGLMLKSSNETANPAYFATSEKNLTGPTMVVTYNTSMSTYFKNSVSLDVGDVDATSIVKQALPSSIFTVEYTSANKYIATVSTTGTVTGISVGTTTVNVKITSQGHSQEMNCTVNVGTVEPGCPEHSTMFTVLKSWNYLSDNEIVKTGDGFYMTIVSVGTILSRIGITLASNDPNYKRFFYCLGEPGVGVNGIVTMDTTNTISSKVSVSFISFDYHTLIACISNETTTTVNALTNALTEATTDTNAPNPSLYEYFRSASNDASYLIAEVYVRKVVEDTFSGNSLTVNSTANGYVQNYDYWMDILATVYEYVDNGILNDNIIDCKDSELKNAVLRYNQLAGRTVYNLNNRVISLQDRNNLSYIEKCMILISHTGNTSMHSFAAEIKAHADWVNFNDSELDFNLFGDFVIELLSMDDYVNESVSIADMNISAYGGNFSTNAVVQMLLYEKIPNCVTAHPEYRYDIE